MKKNIYKTSNKKIDLLEDLKMHFLYTFKFQLYPDLHVS